MWLYWYGLYQPKNLNWNSYVEIVYQSNDWTFFINHKNFVDMLILMAFTFFFIFTLIHLSIKLFLAWKN